MTVPFSAEQIVAVLDRHGVDYVLIGGYAAAVYGAQRATFDVDITPERSPDNLDRLVAALQELQARIRVDAVSDGLPFATSTEALWGVRMLNLQTPFGDLDLTFEPAGTHGYPDLNADATAQIVDGVVVRVASLDDIIRSKEAAGRDKDAVALPELYRLRGERGGARHT